MSLKRYFITFYLMFLSIVGVFAISQVIRSGSGSVTGISALGLAIAALIPLAFFIWLMTAKPARTSSHPLPVTLLSGAGLVIIMLQQTQGPPDRLFWLAFAAFLGWIIYLRWYSRLPQPHLPHLQAGQTLPAFDLTDLNGATVKSDQFRGHIHILLFYRGNWCPLCMAQIQEIAGHWRQLHALGVEVALISPQPQGHSEKLAQRFDVPLRFFSDPNNRAAERLGIAAPGTLPLGMELWGYGADAVLPTVIVVDENGHIIKAHQTDNYRLRPEPDYFIELVQQHRRQNAGDQQH
ncbi:MAG: hypothetical protein Tsb002_28600 [Wenzhouxiangellaceae bacterium]